jgi:hypothetical protein
MSGVYADGAVGERNFEHGAARPYLCLRGRIALAAFGGTIGGNPALCPGMKTSKKSSSSSSRGRSQDRRQISLQRHEIDHVVAKLQEEFRPIIKQAVLAAKRALGGETRRSQVMVEARRRLLAHA